MNNKLKVWCSYIGVVVSLRESVIVLISNRFDFFLLKGLLLCLFLIGLGWGYSGILDTMIYQIVWNAADVLAKE